MMELNGFLTGYLVGSFLAIIIMVIIYISLTKFFNSELNETENNNGND